MAGWTGRVALALMIAVVLLASAGVDDGRAGGQPSDSPGSPGPGANNTTGADGTRDGPEPGSLAVQGLCYGALAAVLVVIVGSLMRRRTQWAEYVNLYPEQSAAERETFLRLTRRSMTRTALSVAMVLAVLAFALLFSLAFIYSLIGDYAWYVFLAMVVASFALSLKEVLDSQGYTPLDREHFAFVHGFVERVSHRFGVRTPRLNVSPDVEVNASAISFFGRKNTITLSYGLVMHYAAQRMTDDQLLAIVGHELGHIVNRDASVTTVLLPVIQLVKGIRTVLEKVIRGIWLLMKLVFKMGTVSLLTFVIAVGVILALVMFALVAGIFYAMFYLLAGAVTLCWNVYSRQREYAADLFGALTVGSRTVMGTALMEITREEGLARLKRLLVLGIVEGMYERGEVSATAYLSGRVHERVYDELDIHEKIEGDPSLLECMPADEAGHLVSARGMEPFDGESLASFAQYRFSLREQFEELRHSHPLGAKRVRQLASLDATSTGASTSMRVPSATA